MPMPTFRQLRYFEALARHGHFGRAAEECAVSQPALSMQIRELEKALGAELVERRQDATVLTSLGTEVAKRASDILSAVRDLADCARHGNEVLTGSLRLGVIPTLAPYVLPRVLPALAQRFPRLRLDLQETQTRLLLQALIRGTLDAILLALPLERPVLETLPLFDDRFLLAVPAEDPLPEHRRISARDVNARRLILLEEGHCLRDQALAFCAPRADAETGLSATSLATIMQMVASGYGVTLVPEVAVDIEVRNERIKLLRFVEPQPQRSIGLAWRPTSPRKADFFALGRVIVGALEGERPQRRARQTLSRPAAAP